MNADLSYRYFLLSNIVHSEDIPFDILKLIMLMICDRTVYVFNGRNDVIIITNRGLYGQGLNIFGKHYINLTLINLDINLDIYNIKKIAFGDNILYILYNNGSVLTYLEITKKFIHTLDNIESMSSNQNYACFISKNKELYVCGSSLPKLFGKCTHWNSGRGLKTELTNVKDVVCYPGEITVLFENGTIVHYDDDYQFLDLPFIDQIDRYHKYLFGIDKNIVYTYKLYYDTDESSSSSDTDESNPSSDINESSSSSDINESSSDSYSNNLNHDDANKSNIEPDDNLIINYFNNDIKTIAHYIDSIFVLDIKGKLYRSCIEKFGEQWANKMTKIDLPFIESIHCGASTVIAITNNGDLYGCRISLGNIYQLTKISL